MWVDGANSSYPSSAYNTISGKSITDVGDAEVIDTVDSFTLGSDYPLDAVRWDADTIIACYVDDGDSDRGVCIIGDIAGAEAPARRIIIIE